MDSTRQSPSRLIALAVILVAAACRPPAGVTPPPTTAPSIDEAVPSTLPEVRALRATGRERLYERGLRAIAVSGDPTSRRRAQSLLALYLFDAKRWEDAAAELELAATLNPEIGPFLRLRAIEALEKVSRIPEAIAVATGIIATTPDNSAATVARLRLPALYAAVGKEALMNAALEQTAPVAVDELTEGDFAGLARGLDASGKSDPANRIRMRVLREYPGGRFTEDLYAAVAAAAPSPLDALPTSETTALASALARADRYDQALDLLRRLSSRPGAVDDRTYQSVRLRSLFYSRHYTELVQETAGRELDPAAELLRARAAWRSDRPEEFLAGLARIETSFPSSREAIEAKVQRAKYYVTDVVDYARAIQNLSAAIDAGAEGSDGENVWNLGWIYTLAGRDQDALRTFDRYARSYPDGDWKTNALFWSAKIDDKLGRTADRDAKLHQIENEYPYSYYAYRAREILGEPAVAPDVVPNGAIFPDIDAQLAAVSGTRIDTVRELLAVDLTRDATRETKLLSSEYPDNAGVAFLLADVYAGGGEPFKANGVLQRRFRQFVRHGGTNVPRRFWEILFPLNYWDTIRSEAAKRNLDPYLVASIIRQESGFEPTTVSNAGAVGLMQIMPAEAARIATAAGLGDVTRQQLFDPIINIQVGAAEFSQKLEAMQGNPILAIAAYNAGEDAVGKWIAQTPVGETDLFVEAIPYAETRLYVKSVTRNRFEYRRIYGSNNAPHPH